MKIAVIGTSPAMLVVASKLMDQGCTVCVYDGKYEIGGAWASPGEYGLNHKYANIIVAYDAIDKELLEKWWCYLTENLNMAFEPTFRDKILINSKYQVAYFPNFQNLYHTFKIKTVNEVVSSIHVDGVRVSVNESRYDQIFLPVHCAIDKIIINDQIYSLPFQDVTSTHAVCVDHRNQFQYCYAEQNDGVIDRYFKDQSTSVFIARLTSEVKILPPKEIEILLKEFCDLKAIYQYTSHYRNEVNYNILNNIKYKAKNLIQVIDTRQFCTALRSLDTIPNSI